ncbi:probable E3 ubiquitin-protein ligase ARI9 [Olea europaea var. sylvestris]|uniref:probable E3 ubiquitin-protein ligase ARI9 n=1 Tax=Olea europaea var. sylvestris TaxID=158386 RepID=UPI000C1D3916|nr:probable E3 ubiquitin-protein ligase ARI9 [Olea europaea var. sylvestris]
MAVKEQTIIDGSSADETKEEEEDFRSCCGDEDEVEDTEEPTKADLKDDLDDYSVKMYFKGVSIAGPGDSGSRLSGIGVVMERSCNFSPIRVQKKLDFYVEESVADYLALLDGLSEAAENNIRRVFAFTESDILYYQITKDEELENPLLAALRLRILEQTSNMETFVLKFVRSTEILNALQLAKVAVGIVSIPAKGDKLTEICSICSEERFASMMITIKCSHKFCSDCMKTYVKEKMQYTCVPIRCPQLSCKYCISTAEFRSFLPVTSYESLERSLKEANILDKICCPYPNCSVMLDPHECLLTRTSSSSQTDNGCMECPVCRGFICMDCGVPWHTSMTCEEYQNLPFEEREACYTSLVQNKGWRRCQHCHRMIELNYGCYHIRCRCGHEFCYSCGTEYRNGQQTCECTFWNEDYSNESANYPIQDFEQWAWDSFESLPMMMDAYSDQEKSQLALIQRFLAGAFSLTDHQPQQSPPPCTDSYVDAMKDLHQLPWLERFVSVMSDNYYDDYIQ